jgi:hypothetical protein
MNIEELIYECTNLKLRKIINEIIKVESEMQ